KGVLITGPKLKAFRNPQPSWGFSVHNKKPSINRGLLHTTGSETAKREEYYSHSIIYGQHKQLTDNNFMKTDFHRTVLYTVTG
ncbi:hypothetical protein, partial [Citrobacter braakii]|nr:hypothetical protein [Citrobacter braakii]MEB0946951.1 hypothetical protein [Citrobacter braakii]MEB0972188.1 hypothetical protein [Citrobacter braakii]MEB0996545.1 hypothetical protein [Citrobacter braakii]MEB1012197.1 hypothetical protein [Citrobacter braakii]